MIEDNFNGFIIEGTADLFIIHIQFTKKKINNNCQTLTL